MRSVLAIISGTNLTMTTTILITIRTTMMRHGMRHEEDEDDELLGEDYKKTTSHDSVVKETTVEDNDNKEDIVGRHRDVFMERAFGGDDKQANNVICCPNSEIEHIICPQTLGDRPCSEEH